MDGSFWMQFADAFVKSCSLHFEILFNVRRLGFNWVAYRHPGAKSKSKPGIRSEPATPSYPTWPCRVDEWGLGALAGLTLRVSRKAFVVSTCVVKLTIELWGSKDHNCSKQFAPRTSTIDATLKFRLINFCLRKCLNNKLEDQNVGHRSCKELSYNRGNHQ